MTWNGQQFWYDITRVISDSSVGLIVSLLQAIPFWEFPEIPGNSYVLNFRREFPGIPEIPPGILGNL